VKTVKYIVQLRFFNSETATIIFVQTPNHHCKTNWPMSTFSDFHFFALFNVLNITLSFWLGFIALILLG